MMTMIHLLVTNTVHNEPTGIAHTHRTATETRTSCCWISKLKMHNTSLKFSG